MTAPAPVATHRRLPHLTDAEFRTLTAHHEAGHIVVGALTGHTVLSATILPPTDGTTPQLAPAGGTDMRWNVPTAGHLTMLFAGYCASRRWLSDAGLWRIGCAEDLQGLCADDQAEAARTLAAAGGGDPRTAWASAERAVAAHWAPIGLVAAELHRAGTLDAAAVARVLAAALPRKASR